MNSSLQIPPATASSMQPESPWLIDLSQLCDYPQSQLGELVGNKALHLSRMQTLGHRVPDGFCITSRAFQQGYQSNRNTLTPMLRAAILTAFRQLLVRYPDSRFVVRSSAPEEDGQHASWAGLFHSSLNIGSTAELQRAIERGFDSLNSDRVKLYRQQRSRQPLDGQSEQDAARSSKPTMALIVQRQIEPTAAGMVFTRNPLVKPGDPEHSFLCINAVRGLAETLADGETNGELYWLDDDNRLQQQRSITAQSDRAAPSSGRSPTQPPVLNRAQMRQVAQAARLLEQQFGYPLDIEFALQNRQLWLLQARAIVTSKVQHHADVHTPPLQAQPPVNTQPELSRSAQRWLKQEQRRLSQRLQQLQQQRQLHYGAGILSNSNIAELLPSPTPMSFAVFNQIFAGPDGAIPMGRRALGYATEPDSTQAMFELVAGQPYFHLEIDALSYQYREGNNARPKPLPIADYLAQIRTDPARANYPEFGLYQQFMSQPNAASDDSAQAQRYQHSRRFHRHMSQHGQHYLRQYRSWVDTYLQQHLQQQRSIDLSSLNAPQLIIQINQWLRHLRQISCCHFVMTARIGFYFAESLRFELQQWVGDQAQNWITRLLQALPGSRINQQSFDLQAVNQQQLSRQDYLDRYGHLSSNELELSLPRYSDKPELIDALLDQSAKSSAGEQPQQAFEQQWRLRKQQERKLSKQLNQIGLSAEQRQQLWSDLRLARRFLPLRETIKYHYAGEYALIRQALLQLSQRLRLGAEQIFYLQPDELPLCLKELPAMRRLIRQRQQQHQLTLEVALQQPLPAVIFGDMVALNTAAANPDRPADGEHAANDRSGNHHGQPMAPGFIRGKVRLIDPQHCDLHQLMARVDKDDIIVTRSANLGLAPLLRKVAGLVVEVGGLLAHSACQAREAGIPAMVLADATRLLSEGSLVAFDGQTGQLRFEQ